MNYIKIYNDLISKAKTRQCIEEGEIHHIVPRSMGGQDTKDNLVKLTYREHFIAHLLLYKIHKNQSMAFALGRMCNTKNYTVTSKTYSIARKAHRSAVSKWSKEYMSGKTVFKNLSTGERRLFDVDNVPNGWVGIQAGKKFSNEKTKGFTVYKDSDGVTYRLRVGDPLIKELNLKGVGNTSNAIKAAAVSNKSKLWYEKPGVNKNTVLLIPELYNWYINKYDDRSPKATGLSKFLSSKGIETVNSKVLRKAFNKFKEGWVPNDHFYEVYNEIIKNQ